MMKKILLGLALLSQVALGEGRIKNPDIASDAAISPSKIASGNWSGNAATATALASDPVACSANQFVTDIAANGTLTCSAVDGLPTQTGNSGKFLTTNGSAASWDWAATSLSGDVTGSVSGSAAISTTIANDAVTNAKAANMAQSTFKGRAAGAGTGDPTDLTATQATAILNEFTGDSGSGGVKGLVPAPSAGDAASGYGLKADGTWGAVGTASPLTTKGDIYVYGSGQARLPVGTNDYLLVPDSAQSLGLKWTQTLPSGAFPALSGDVTTPAGSLSTTVANDAVTNAKAANMAESTIKGRAVGAGTGDPTDLTATQATAILNAVVGDSGSGGTKGLVPTPAAGEAASREVLGASGAFTPQLSGVVNLAMLDTAANNWALTKPDNFDLENSAGDWTAYADAAATIPVDMTGGSPNTTCASSSSSPLNGSSSLLITLTTGASRQGEGCAVVVNIPGDSAGGYRGKPLKVSFPYSTTGTVTAGDFVIYAYDVTNGALLAPSTVITGITGTTGIAHAQFITQTSTAQLRIGLHIARTSTGSATIALDDFRVEPDLSQANIPVSDWTAFTPTGSWSSNTTYTGFWRRVGDSIEVSTNISLAGAPTSAGLTLTLPNGLTLDTAKLTANTSSVVPIVGFAEALDAGTAAYHGQVATTNASTTTVTVRSDTGAWSQITPITFGSGDQISIYYKVPISGWSSGGGTSPILSLSDWTPYTVTITGSSSNPAKGTTTYDQGYWRRVGDSMHIRYQFKQSGAGSAGSGVYLFSIPSGYTIDSNKVQAATTAVTGTSLGAAGCSDGSLTAMGSVYARSTTALSVATSDPSNTQIGSTLCPLSDADTVIGIEAAVPIAGWTSTSSGTLTAPRDQIIVDSGNGFGSTNTTVRRFTNTRWSTGSCITYSDSAGNGATFTVTDAAGCNGIYSITYHDQSSAGAATIGITVNGASLTTAPSNITYANGLRAFSDSSAASFGAFASWEGYLARGDIVRAQAGTNADSTNQRCMFTMVKGMH